MREKAIALLAHALTPPNALPPEEAARRLEAALHERYAQRQQKGTPAENGAVGGRTAAAGCNGADPGAAYLRRLRVLWDWLLPGSPVECPHLRQRFLRCASPVTSVTLAVCFPTCIMVADLRSVCSSSLCIQAVIALFHQHCPVAPFYFKFAVYLCLAGELAAAELASLSAEQVAAFRQPRDSPANEHQQQQQWGAADLHARKAPDQARASRDAPAPQRAERTGAAV